MRCSNRGVPMRGPGCRWSRTSSPTRQPTWRSQRRYESRDSVSRSHPEGAIGPFIGSSILRNADREWHRSVGSSQWMQLIKLRHTLDASHGRFVSRSAPVYLWARWRLPLANDSSHEARSDRRAISRVVRRIPWAKNQHRNVVWHPGPGVRN